MKQHVSGTGVHNEHRLSVLRQLGILDSPCDPIFEHFTDLVTHLLEVPVALISIVDADRQFFKSATGLQEPWASRRETPLSHSFCQYVVETDQPFIVSDASNHPLVSTNLAIRDLHVYAYIGTPLTTSKGIVLGALCAIDTAPREWHQKDIDVLNDLATSVISELELRYNAIAHQKDGPALPDSRVHCVEAFNYACIGMALVDLQGKCLQVNQAFCSLLGYSQQELAARSLDSLVYPNDLHKDQAYKQQILRDEIKFYREEKRYIHKLGSILWLELNVALVRDVRGIAQYFVCQFQDISQRRQQQYEQQQLIEQLTEALDRQQTLLRQSSEDLQRTEALYNVAATLNYTQTIPTILHTVVESAAQVLPAHRSILITVDMNTQQIKHHLEAGPGAINNAELTFAELWNGLSGVALRKCQPVFGSKAISDTYLNDVSDSPNVEEESGTILIVPIQSHGIPFGTLAALNPANQKSFNSSDMDLLVTLANHAAVAIERSILVDELQYYATTDGLTQILNRRSWFEQSERVITMAEQTGQSLSVVLLDIDHFKRINDTYGHAVGDIVLQQVSQLIHQKIRKIDILGRYGGEEFVVLLPETATEVAVQIAERIRISIERHFFRVEEYELAITISLGVVTTQGRDLDMRLLLMQADQALYQAKKAGRNRIQLMPNAIIASA